MRTVCCSSHLLGGGVCPWGCLPTTGGCLPATGECLPARGVSASQGVSACPGEGCLPRRVSACHGDVCLPVGCLPARGMFGRPPLDRILDTRLWKHYLSSTSFADGNKRSIMSNILVLFQTNWWQSSEYHPNFYHHHHHVLHTSTSGRSDQLCKTTNCGEIWNDG